LVQVLPERTSITHLETLLLLVRLFLPRKYRANWVVPLFVLSEPTALGVRFNWECHAAGFVHRVES
jgi:hypothetical protein